MSLAVGVFGSGMASHSTVAASGMPASTGAVVSNCDVYGSHNGTETFGIFITEDSGGNGATPEILNCKVEGGLGTDLSVGIYAHGSAPFISHVFA